MLISASTVSSNWFNETNKATDIMTRKTEDNKTSYELPIRKLFLETYVPIMLILFVQIIVNLLVFFG